MMNDKTQVTMPNNVNELMSMAAEALDEGDVERLQNLRDYIRGWMQLDEEMIAQFEMLDAMAEAAEMIEGIFEDRHLPPHP